MTDEHHPSLDALLTRSAPATTAHTTRVHRELVHLAEVTGANLEPAPARSRAPRRAGRRLALGAGAVLVTFAGVSAAAASPSAPSWLGWAHWGADAINTAPPGSCAVYGTRISSIDTRDPAVRAARQYLAGLDLSRVDYTTELESLRNEVTTVDGGQLGGTTEVPMTEYYSDQQLIDQAYTHAIAEMVWADVERQGFDKGRVQIDGRAEGCEPTAER